VGAQVLQVYDGYNKVPVALINPAFNQGVHLQSFGNPGFIAAYRWMAATQTWQSWTPGAMVWLQVILGESPVVHLTMGPPSHRVLTGTVPAPDDFGVDLLAGDNLLVLPLSHPDTLASELLASIPQATRIGRWDPAAQITRWYDGQPSTSRTMPTMSAAVADINPGSGVKSNVISIRSRRGRTPIPVERRFAPATMTGTGRTCASRSASFCTLRLRFRSSRCSSNEMLK